MDEEQLKALLGENFDGAKEFFKDQVLGNGDYVRKEMSDASINSLKKQLEDANNTIKAKMTDEEKEKASRDADKATIEDLQKQLAEQIKMTNRSYAVSNITEAIKLAEIKEDDKNLSGFIDNITSDDREKTKSVSKYINDMVKNAYEKGKAEATKQNLSKIGNFNANKSDVSGSKSNESIAKRLAESNAKMKNTKSNYFKN